MSAKYETFSDNNNNNSDSEDEENNDVILEEMLRRAERLATEIKGASLVPDTIEMTGTNNDECSSVGGLDYSSPKIYETHQQARVLSFSVATGMSQDEISKDENKSGSGGEDSRRGRDSFDASPGAAKKASARRTGGSSYASGSSNQEDIEDAIRSVESMRLELESLSTSAGEEVTPTAASPPSHTWETEPCPQQPIKARTFERVPTLDDRKADPRSITTSAVGDDDYVPIADYSGSGGGSTKCRESPPRPTYIDSSTGICWEKVTFANEGDDDYVPMADYSASQSSDESRPEDFTDHSGRSQLTYAQDRATIRRRRKQRRRRMAGFAIAVAFAVACKFLFHRRSAKLAGGVSSGEGNTQWKPSSPNGADMLPSGVEKDKFAVDGTSFISTPVTGTAAGTLESTAEVISPPMNDTTAGTLEAIAEEGPQTIDGPRSETDATTKDKICDYALATLISPICKARKRSTISSQTKRKRLEELLSILME
jgi:hypothetical protein